MSGWNTMSSKKRTFEAQRLNDLDGKTWTRYSISIWEFFKSSEENRLRHPALFPQALIQRILEIYTRPGDTILDPFMGAGSSLIAAQMLKRRSIGFEISPEYISLAKKRVQINKEDYRRQFQPQIYFEDARSLKDHIAQNSIDLVVTSPPYWDVHRQRRTADRKSPRPYSQSPQDLGNISSYSAFLDNLSIIFGQLYSVLKPKRWCILIVMDLRKRHRFYPFHIDCIHRMNSCGFILEDIIIWDRRRDYHNLRPLGYPTTFRVNKVHEYILIFQKPV